MTYQHAEFDAIYAEAYRRLTARMDACVTDKGRAEAFHHRNAIVINYGFWRNHYATERQRFMLCSCCGIMTHSDYMEPSGSSMRKHRMCFHCDYWQNEMPERIRAGKHPLIIEGTMYGDAGRQPANTPFLGFGGSEFTYRRLGETEIHSTNNLWHGGDIPEAFRHLYENNAEFVK